MKSLLERDLEVVAQVGAAFLAAAALAAPAHDIAEEVVEDVGHRRAEAVAHAAGAAALLEGRMTITVIGRALLRV